jgi:ribokinase
MSDIARQPSGLAVIGSVTVVGSVNIDLAVLVDHIPAAGETVVAHTPGELYFGGKGANQAAAAAAMGGNVSMVGRIGSDDVGQHMRADLAARGVQVGGVLTTPRAQTGRATIAVDRHGENLIIVDPGANHRLSADDVGIPAVRDAAVLLVQLEIPFDVAAAAITTARGLVVLNPAPPAPLPPGVLEHIDVLVPNMSELGLLADQPTPGNPTQAGQLAESLGRRFDVVVTMGSLGALVVPRAGEHTHIEAPVVDVVDTTGAGDCFCGALAVGLAEGLDLVAAAQLAVVAAALSTTAPGARDGLPTRERVDAQLLAARG